MFRSLKKAVVERAIGAEMIEHLEHGSGETRVADPSVGDPKGEPATDFRHSRSLM
jgi:hypothetical protein